MASVFAVSKGLIANTDGSEVDIAVLESALAEVRPLKVAVMERNIRMFFGNVILETKIDYRGNNQSLVEALREFVKSHGGGMPSGDPVVEEDFESGLLKATWLSANLDFDALKKNPAVVVINQHAPKKEESVVKKVSETGKEKSSNKKKVDSEPPPEKVVVEKKEAEKKEVKKENVEEKPLEKQVLVEEVKEKDPEPGPLEIMQQKIEHVVILMLENRGLDTVLGWLYEDEDPEKIVGAQQDDRDFFDALGHLRAAEKPDFTHGLKTAVYRTANPATLKDDKITANETFYIRRGAQFPHSPFVYTHEDHEHITLQVFGEAFEEQQGSPTLEEVKAAEKEPAPMNGFAQDFLSNVKGHHKPAKKSARVQAELIQDLFDVYTPDQLPALNGLARHYAVSDEWFCSAPTQTNANRAFFLGATSLGLSKNGYLMDTNWEFKRILADDRFNCKTIWHVLSVDGKQTLTPKGGKPITWRHYHHTYNYPFSTSKGPYTWRLFPKVKEDKLCADPDNNLKENPKDARFVNMVHFWDDVANDNLTTVSIIEPAWSYGYTTDYSQGSVKGAQGNDYHAPGNTTQGEEFVKNIYRALSRKKKVWEKTLLVITFDENGGTYDHVPPPWGAVPPWGEARNYDKSPQGKDPVLKKARQYGFNFDRFGVRVPTLLISPYIKKGTVFRSKTYDYKKREGAPFDHTSLMKTIFKWLKIPAGESGDWGMGERLKAAPTFEDVFVDAKRSDTEPFELIPSWMKGKERGQPLCYGKPFLMQNPDSGKYVGRAYPGKLEWFPTVKDPSDHCFLTLFKLVEKEDGFYEIDIDALVKGEKVYNEDVVLICSNEDKLKNKRFIGAYQTQTNCIYAEQNLQKDKNIAWKIQLVGYFSNDEVCLGDRVYLFNRGSGKSSDSITSAETYHFHRFCESGAYTMASQRNWAPWVLEAPVRTEVEGNDLTGTDTISLWENKALVLGKGGTSLKDAKAKPLPSSEKLTLTDKTGEKIEGKIENGAIVRIKREDGDFLGNWYSGCYFSSKSEQEDGQQWKVIIAGYPPDPKDDETMIKDGEKVYIISMSTKYMGYHLINKNGKVNTSNDGFQSWVLKKME